MPDLLDGSPSAIAGWGSRNHRRTTMSKRPPRDCDWSAAEKARLRYWWKKPDPIKTWVDKFPGRTQGAIEAKAHEMRLPNRHTTARPLFAENTTGARIRDAIIASPSTRAQLEALKIASPSTICRFIRMHRASMHIHGYAERSGSDGYAAEIWAWGEGVDAPRPKTISKAEAAMRYYRKKSRSVRWKREEAARQRERYHAKKGNLLRGERPMRDEAAIALFGETGTASASE
ncbi:TPA: hypothetical protein QDC51_001262 [Burkholderia multivorans]|uniref:hypothetical protein n=1 Tax=Burkholderia multivorans TaxID=87883 RepID=UPI0011B20C9A|nr:hypothetical protein [Burkholderia multivorans]MBU9351732.1 hypothetical protein [Burkholderia multivorans]MBU9394913.1 hypothetical protein [Burkholderia multivorans]HDR9834503.1 hypothetical protein [Burkholderia multivorans]HDR9840447.1 hypothetical protein [Burkholderia multivorans]HDR9846450.1 hypothetical protein [Burkholderia multivorans]